MSELNNSEDMNEVVEEEIDDAEVMTVPIDDTLSISGEAADAKATGDALALKADKSEIQTQITVNEQQADANGNITLLATHIEMNDSEQSVTVAEMMEQISTGIGDVSGELDALEDDVVTLSEQTLTSEQQAQARTNIDAAGPDELATLDAKFVKVPRITKKSVTGSGGTAWISLGESANVTVLCATSYYYPVALECNPSTGWWASPLSWDGSKYVIPLAGDNVTITYYVLESIYT